MTTILEKTAGLVAFVRTVDSGSFSAAARSIGTSPSAVSKSVARLEKRLGTRLVQRSTRALKLTAEGSAYYERVAPLLRAIEDAEDVLQLSGEASGLLRVTAPIEIGRTVIARWLEPFAARHPKLKIELHLIDRQVDLVRERFDVAVRMGRLPNGDLVGRKLAEFETVLIASPIYLANRGHPRDVNDLKDHAILRYLLGLEPQPIPFADGSTLLGDGPFDANDGATLKQAAVSGAGIAYMMRLAVEDEIASGRLVQVLPDVALRKLPVHVLHAYGRMLPGRIRLFTDFMVEQTKAMLKP